MPATRVEIEAARQKATPVEEYLPSIIKLYRWKFMNTRKDYQLAGAAVASLEPSAKDYFVLAFSAAWCEDCSKYIPVLALLAEATGLEVRVFGKIKTDPLSQDSLWRIPPSPPEVLTFDVQKLPWILLYDRQGNEIGRIVEQPSQADTIEEELVAFIRASG